MPRQPGLQLLLADAGHDAALRGLLGESRMQGRIRLSLRCEPSYFAMMDTQGDTHYTLAAVDQHGAVVGMGSRAVSDLFVAGSPRRVGYLGHFRSRPDHRWRIKTMGAAYRMLDSTRTSAEEPYDITSVMADNAPALAFFRRGVSGLPAYTEVGRMVTLTLRPAAAGHSGNRRVVRADSGMLHGIVDCLRRNCRRFNFAPCWTVENVLSDSRTPGLAVDDFYVVLDSGDVKGCAALWDQSSFKQVIIEGYDGLLGFTRHFVNALAPFFRMPFLPAPGTVLPQTCLSHVAVDNDDKEVFLDLLHAVCRDLRDDGHRYLTVGFSAGSPLAAAVRNAFRVVETPSILFAVSYGVRLPEELRALPAQPEVAVL
ncbi:MAG: hypothetical protein JW909_09150 [Planctomycetes bacterium]|nr:hypothetical protein [Planctomycetota bacterium]